MLEYGWMPDICSPSAVAQAPRYSAMSRAAGRKSAKDDAHANDTGTTNVLQSFPAV
jgi:hypothetical protein